GHLQVHHQSPRRRYLGQDEPRPGRDVPFHVARCPGAKTMSAATPCVFVVDDDPSLRKALGRLLKSAGFQVETLPTPEEFLRRPALDGPACLILDVRMPGLSGLDLQHTLAERHDSLPIVFITGHGD